MVLKKCAVCGKDFDAVKKAKTCSDTCSSALDLKYQREYHKVYQKQPEQRKYHREYQKQPEQIEYHRKYQSQTEQRRYHKEYQREHQKEYQKEYRIDYYNKYSIKWQWYRASTLCEPVGTRGVGSHAVRDESGNIDFEHEFNIIRKERYNLKLIKIN